MLVCLVCMLQLLPALACAELGSSCKAGHRGLTARLQRLHKRAQHAVYQRACCLPPTSTLTSTVYSHPSLPLPAGKRGAGGSSSGRGGHRTQSARGGRRGHGGAGCGSDTASVRAAGPAGLPAWRASTQADQVQSWMELSSAAGLPSLHVACGGAAGLCGCARRRLHSLPSLLMPGCKAPYCETG